MRNTLRTLLLALLSLSVAGVAAPAAAAEVDPVVDCDRLISTDVSDAPSTRLCDHVDAILDSIAVSRTTLYQEVSPDGKWGNLDCVYDSLANRSVVVEWWQIWVEAGTIDNQGNRHPIVATHVYYLWVATVSGNAC